MADNDRHKRRRCTTVQQAEQDRRRDIPAQQSDEEAAQKRMEQYCEKVLRKTRAKLEHAWAAVGLGEDFFAEETQPEELSEQEQCELTRQVLERYKAMLKDRIAAKEAIEAAYAAEGRPPPDFSYMNPDYVASLSEAEQEAYIWSQLDDRVAEQARNQGITSFFQIQRGVLPHALRDANKPQEQPVGVFRDLCVSAPTGSGKTLIYALTIQQALAERRLRILRAVIVAPTRELARQVYIEMIRFTPEKRHPDGTLRIRIAISIGGREDTLFQERPSLYAQPVSIACPISTERPHPDILVCTPGKLVDHIDFTPGFTLQHVRYLVADEADRLVSQRFQGWAKKTIHACFDDSEVPVRPDLTFEEVGTKIYAPVTRRSLDPKLARAACEPRLQKLLFSATLGDDPGQLHTFLLERPKFFYFGDNDQIKTSAEPTNAFALPPTLKEHTTLTSAAQKPLVLLSLIEDGSSGGLCIVFANSVDTTLRLACLLRLWFLPNQVFELSSALTARQRDATLEACRLHSELDQPRPRTILVASDAASRGIDLDVGLVVNYDMPTNVRSYVHRLGRAARAGRSGTAITLIKRGQESDFRRMRRSMRANAPVEKLKVPRARLEPLTPKYRECLAQLQDAVRAAKKGHRPQAAFQPPPDPDEPEGTDSARCEYHPTIFEQEPILQSDFVPPDYVPRQGKCPECPNSSESDDDLPSGHPSPDENSDEAKELYRQKLLQLRQFVEKQLEPYLDCDDPDKLPLPVAADDDEPEPLFGDAVPAEGYWSLI